MPIAIGCGDADSAFESLPHTALVSGWQCLGAPSLLVAAFYREMAGASAQIVVCGQSTSADNNASLVGGGRPGDVGTPAHWNVAVSLILGLLVPSWLQRGFGFCFDNVVLLVLRWADDFTFAAAGIGQLRIMLDEFAIAMYEHGIQLKASKCK